MSFNEDQLLRYISQKIEEERNSISEDLSLGGAKDHGDYKYACGIIRGLMIANSVLIDLTQKVNSDEYVG